MSDSTPPASGAAQASALPSHELYRSVEATVAHHAQLREQLAAHAAELSARTAALLGGAE